MHTHTPLTSGGGAEIPQAWVSLILSLIQHTVTLGGSSDCRSDLRDMYVCDCVYHEQKGSLHLSSPSAHRLWSTLIQKHSAFIRIVWKNNSSFAISSILLIIVIIICVNVLVLIYCVPTPAPPGRFLGDPDLDVKSDASSMFGFCPGSPPKWTIPEICLWGQPRGRFWSDA